MCALMLQVHNLELLNVFTPVHSEFSHQQSGGVNDLMLVSAAKWCPFLSAGAEAACKTQLCSVWPLSPLGRITHKLLELHLPNGPAQCLPILILAIILQLLILLWT